MGGRPIGAGDFDGDGAADVLLYTAANETQVVLGGTWTGTRALSLDPGEVRVLGTWGTQLVLGDLDGDGRADLAAQTGYDAGTSRYRTAVVAGRTRTALPVVLDLATDAPDARILSGWALAFHPTAAADLDGDGRADLLGGGSGGGPTPALIEVRGSSPLPAVRDLETDPADQALYTTWNESVVSADPVAGDFDGDGAPDLAFSASGDGERGTGGGPQVHVVRGPLAAGAAPRDLAAEPPWATVYGAAVRAAGDFDGDGKDDLVLATQTNLPSEPNTWVIRLLRGESWPLGAAPGNLYVSPSGSDGNAGLSWAAALATVREALRRIDATTGPVTIRVGEGTYAGGIVVGSETRLLGGYHPAGLGARNPTRHRTTVDAGDRYDASTGGRALVVRNGQGTRIDGFTFRRGSLDVSGYDGGAGALVAGRNLATIANSRFLASRVRAEKRWTGFDCSDPVFEICAPSKPGIGAGLHLVRGLPVLDNVLVASNTASVLDECLPSWPHCGGTADYFRPGAGIFAGGSSVLRNVTVAANVGDGIATGFPTTYEIVEGQLDVGRSILWGSITAPNQDPAADLADGRLAGPHTLTFNLVGTGPSGLDPTNLRVDPLFVNAAAGDFRLRNTAAGDPVESPAVDAGGVPSATVCPGLPGEPCLDGMTATHDGGADLGPADLG